MRTILPLCSLLLITAQLAGGAQAQETRPDSAPASAPESRSAESQKAVAAELWRLGRRAEALQAYEAAYTADKTVENGIVWARALMADSRLNDTLRALDTVSETHKKSPQLFLAYADAFATRAEVRRREGADIMTVLSEYEAAARAIQDTLEVTPNNYDLYFPLCRYFVAAGKWEEAAEVCAEARKSNPTVWQLALAEGDARSAGLEADGKLDAGADAASKAERKEKVDAIAASYAEAAKLAPDRAEPQARLGALLLKTGGDKQKAKEHFAKALAISPADAAPGPVLGVLSPKETVAYFEKALAEYKKNHPKADANDPGDAAIHWYLGYGKYINDDRKGAEECFKTVVKKTPKDGSARYYLAKIAYFDKRYGEAAAEFDAIAKQSPKELAALGSSDSLFLSIAKGLVEKLIVGDSGGAVTVVAGNPNIDVAIHIQRAVLEAEPTNAVEWNNLGLFLRDGGRATDALEAYKKALSLTPDDPRVLNDTAVIYHYYLKTNDDEARTMYERAIKLAKEIIANKGASARAKEDARSALGDAEGNLAKLNKNVRRND